MRWRTNYEKLEEITMSVISKVIGTHSERELKSLKFKAGNGKTN